MILFCCASEFGPPEDLSAIEVILYYYYYVIRAYCVVSAILWVGGMDVCNVGRPLFVFPCFMGTPVCVLHAGCLNDDL